MFEVTLNRNLRRNVLRGHPWIYREAIRGLGPLTGASHKQGNNQKNAQLTKVLDQKGVFLAWAVFDPHSVLALRILSCEKDPPGNKNLNKKLEKAFSLRQVSFGAGLSVGKTNGYRLVNGEGDGLPGFVCDIYDTVAVIQFDGVGMKEFWPSDLISDWLLQNTFVKSVYDKSRMNKSEKLIWVAGEEKNESERRSVRIIENDVNFFVDIENGQKTGFFFDQRDNRQFVGSISRDRSMLNLFSYTGGFSMYAGAGGAKHVVSVDMAADALKLADESWAANEFKGSHQSVSADVFDFLEKNKTEKWDMIVVDPPSMAHSEDQKNIAIKKYTNTFALAAKQVVKNGQLSLSSCSSHISFQDFFSIIEEALSLARRKGQILRVSGQGVDHPFPHFCHELRYLKFVHLILD